MLRPRQGATFFDNLRRVCLPVATCKLLDSLYWLASKVKVKVMLRSPVSQPVYLCVKPHLRPKTRFLLMSDIFSLLMWGVLFEERAGQPCTIASCPLQSNHSQVRVLQDSIIFSSIKFYTLTT